MIFQEKCISVFLFIMTIYVQLGESTNLRGLNRTLFLFNNPKSCKNNEFYNLDYFMCLPCDSKENLKPSFDKLTCDCENDATIVALYDSFKNQPICLEPCTNKTNFKCPNKTSYSENTCKLNFINYTSSEDQNGASAKTIRIFPQSELHGKDCKCDLKYNYNYGDYCIWKSALKNYLNHNAYWKLGKLYVELKFVAFFCQSLQNMTACNYLANLCIQSFFDTDKNSPCSVFLLAQASDAGLYSSMGENLNGLRPFLFYKKGKHTLKEIEGNINISEDTLNLFSTVYSLEGELIRWENFKPNSIHPCGQEFQEQHGAFHLFKNVRIACQLTLDSIVDLALTYGNKYFISVFLNHTREDTKQYLQTIPVLIENVFEGNKEPNPAEWQLVKRFQIIGFETTFNLANQPILAYEDSYKLRLFKSIRILRKFELRCIVTEDNKITVPIIVLQYHTIYLSNASLTKKYNFEFLIKFETDSSSPGKLYGIILSIFIAISLLFAIFRAYIFKCRRNLECFDMLVFFQALINFVSNMGNSFLAVVIINVFYLVIIFFSRSNEVFAFEQTQTFELFIYSAITMKGFYFFVSFWRISQIDIFFVDWERPKAYDASLHFKNNLDTSSQCSSIRTVTENNVSAWRIFFLANEWINLSSKQKTSSLCQGFVSLTIFLIANSYIPTFYGNSNFTIFACTLIYSSVYFIQILFRNFLLEQVIDSPLKKFIDICTLANVSIFTLMDCSFGFYIHGRSPHGFSDTDMSSMIFQLQRETQNMCGKRGLLSDSDIQTYIVLPPMNLRRHIEQLLPIKQRIENLSQSYFQKEIGFSSRNMEGVLEKTSYNRGNRFFCAFIDHAIKDMDYIIKEKSFGEHLLDCEFESFVGEQKGTFYIDDRSTFSSLFLYGNQNEIFLMELLICLTMNLLTSNFTISIVTACISNKKLFSLWVTNNISTKTLIEKRFLM